MGRFSLIAVCLLVGCSTPTPPGAADIVVAPAPKIYTCAQEAELAAAWPTLPPIAQQALGDYRAERGTLNRLQGKSGPPACAK